MTVTITIQCDNAAFHEHTSDPENESIDGTEVARILEKFANLAKGDDMHAGYTQALFDINGNKVGKVGVSE